MAFSSRPARNSTVQPARKRWSMVERMLLFSPLLIVLFFYGWKIGQSIYSRWMPKTIPVESTFISSLAYSPDSKFLAVEGWQSIRLPGRGGGEIWIYDAKTLQRRNFFTGGYSAAQQLVFSPDSKLLAIISDHWTRVLDTTTNRELCHFSNTGGTKCRFSADGKFLFVDSRDKQHRWDLSSDTVRLLSSHSIKPAPRGIKTFLSPDNKIRATIDPLKTEGVDTSQIYEKQLNESKEVGGKLKLFNNSSGKLLLTAPGDLYYNATFLPNGKQLIAVAKILDGSSPVGIVLTIIDLTTHSSREIILRGAERWSHQHATTAVSRDARLVAVADSDKKIHLFDSQSGEPLHVWDTDKFSKRKNDWLSDLQFSPDGRQLACSRYDYVEIYDPTPFYKH